MKPSCRAERRYRWKNRRSASCAKVALRNGLIASRRVQRDDGSWRTKVRGRLLTGAGLTNMHYGAPDLGIIGLRDVADAAMRIREAVEDLPLIVDIDTGFGNAVNAWHMRALERAGADAIRSRPEPSRNAAATSPARRWRHCRKCSTRSARPPTRARIRISRSSRARTPARSRGLRGAINGLRSSPGGRRHPVRRSDDQPGGDRQDSPAAEASLLINIVVGGKTPT